MTECRHGLVLKVVVTDTLPANFHIPVLSKYIQLQTFFSQVRSPNCTSFPQYGTSTVKKLLHHYIGERNQLLTSA